MTNYNLSDVHSLFYVLVENDTSTLMSRLGHDHVVRATGWKGTLAYDAARPAETKVDIRIPVSGLRVDEAYMRPLAGLTGSVSDGDCRKTEENMLKKNQLWMDRFAEISFISTVCRAGGEAGELMVTGVMTIRGVSKSLEVVMMMDEKDGSPRARGRFKVRHEDFGFKPYSAPLGALKNRDEITFVIEAVGQL